MRIASLAAAVCGVAMVSGSAEAALTFSSQRASLGAGLDRVTLYALSDASSSTPQGNVLGLDVRSTTPTLNGLRFSVSDEDVVAYRSTVATPTQSSTTTRINRDLSSLVALSDPDLDTAPNDYRNGLTTWRIASSANNGGVGFAADQFVNGGLGLAILAAVVPSGSAVTFAGGIGDATTTQYTVAVTDTGTAIPEPTSLAFLGLAGAGLLGRRRRQA